MSEATEFFRPPTGEVEEIHRQHRKVFEAVAGLGLHPLTIAETLKAEGIKGYVGEPARCAIAQYIRKRFPELKRVRVGFELDVSSTAEVGPLHWEVTDQEVPSNGVLEFISNFDARQYPELIADDDVLGGCP